MARSRYAIFDNDVPYFLTATIVNWLPFFNDPDVVEILLNSLRFLQESGRMVLYAYVILENHLHLIASSPDLSKEMGNFKSYTARQIIDRYKARDAQFILEQLVVNKKAYKGDRDYQFWQEGSHPQRIQSLEMMQQKVAYIHNNPVKRGWVDEPEYWRYSSARNYAGLKSLLDVETDW
ncbi:MAG: transposase [Anaerolineae bacterium]|nr:transposase [Anaerolineae bacterium]